MIVDYIRALTPHGTIRLATLGVILCLVTAACSGGAVDSEIEGGGSLDRDQSTTLVVGFHQEPPDWDYVQNPATAIKALIMHNVVEPLIERMEDGSFEPLLAESFDVSDDSLQYTFTIVEATFHDGSELSADDVVYSLEHHMDSGHSEIAIAFEAVEAIEKLDDRTVQVTLSHPSQKFVQGMSSLGGVVIPEGSADDLSQGPIGTGPFVFENWRHGVEVAVTRFDDYWGDQPFFENVTWRFIPDVNAAVSALLAGDVDIVTGIIEAGVDRYRSVEETEGFTGVTVAGSEITYMSLNAGDDVFDDERVRQAFAHALDRQAIVDGALGGLGQSTCVFVNPANEPWNSDYCPYPHDPERARELLAEAGLEELNVEFKFVTTVYHPMATEIFAAQLAEVGVNAELAARDLATFLDEVLGDPPDYRFVNLAGPQQIDSWTCPGWFTQDCVPELDALLAAADEALDQEEWADLRRQAVELHADRAYLIPIATTDEVAALRDDLVGYKTYRFSSEYDFRPLRWAE